MKRDASQFRRGRHVIYDLHVHLVFVTKYRRECITERVTKVLEGSFRKVCEDFEVVLEEIGWEEDHAHLLISYPPKVALSTLVGSLKGVSSRRLREKGFREVTDTLWGKTFWSPSYCAVSCGGAPLERIKKYVENQKGPVPPRPEGRGFLGAPG